MFHGSDPRIFTSIVPLCLCTHFRRYTLRVYLDSMKFLIVHHDTSSSDNLETSYTKRIVPRRTTRSSSST
ncbi:hypothetical protein AR158_c647R [Paramecium bursaria Chlorella virus AR158]|uniref:hypothetical protein n=1 Tax=Paramecium bursaria Chlorella virus AR158 TaxID=380598 RepID=UPI00015AA802|nr:hypothetical protein AR158_c647R [Paramecium bursaria Chlorella virus AR158]ABU44192.1 hypothetical protein AR158_c647R [Paramecium bursaria Chlorella virus AR158]